MEEMRVLKMDEKKVVKMACEKVDRSARMKEMKWEHCWVARKVGKRVLWEENWKDVQLAGKMVL